MTVSNIEVSKEFYTKIGFEIKYERPEDKFCFLELENNQIMIEEENGNWDVGQLTYPYGNGINISMSVKNVENYYKKLKKKGIKMFLDLEVHSYRENNKVHHDSEFLIQDPDGYLLRFND